MRLLPFQSAWLRETWRPETEISALSLPRGGGKTTLAARIIADLMTPGHRRFDPTLDVDVPGNASMVGRTLAWKSEASDHQVRPLRITVASRDGETRIQAEVRLHRYAGELYGGVVGGAGMGIGLGVGLAVGLGALGSPLWGAAFPVTVIGGLYVAMRQVMKSIGRKRRAELHALVDRIAEYVDLRSRRCITEVG